MKRTRTGEKAGDEMVKNANGQILRDGVEVRMSLSRVILACTECGTATTE